MNQSKETYLTKELKHYWLDIIPKGKLRQVFYPDSPLPEWPEIKVLGPTTEFFNRLFPSSKTLNEFIYEESIESLSYINEEFQRIKRLAGMKPCDRLKNDTTTKTTSTNKASIIIAINDGSKKYLFPGDADIQSFKEIPNWQSELKELYFLKIPHHGSINNISKELIELMKPVYVYNSGFEYQNDDVLECFENNSRNKIVKSTKSHGTLRFPIDML